jgi:signal transduction histidine kinase
METPTRDVGSRVEVVSRGADPHDVALALRDDRDAILDRWLQTVRRQPFHEARPDLAIADHIPSLLDAVTALLERSAASGDDMLAPLDDAVVAGMARAHAKMRFEQGLGPVAVATEFRILRQEIGRALARHLDDDMPTTDVVQTITVVNDALDGAIMLALGSLTEQIESLREDFLATTLHDIRQPVTVIAMSLALAARWAREDDSDQDQLTATLDSAVFATQEIAAVLDTLGDASRVAVGAFDLKKEPTQLGVVLAEVLGVLDPVNRARITADLERDLIGDWDPAVIRRVLTNLISNAMKYSDRESPVEITGRAERGSAVVRVSDQGIGLLPEEIDGLFQRYGRADGGREQGIPGLGLGLYASRGLVEAHGGRIWLESAGRGLGTTACVELPLMTELFQDDLQN